MHLLPKCNREKGWGGEQRWNDVPCDPIRGGAEMNFPGFLPRVCRHLVQNLIAQHLCFAFLSVLISCASNVRSGQCTTWRHLILYCFWKRHWTAASGAFCSSHCIPPRETKIHYCYSAVTQWLFSQVLSSSFYCSYLIYRGRWGSLYVLPEVREVSVVISLRNQPIRFPAVLPPQAYW